MFFPPINSPSQSLCTSSASIVLHPFLIVGALFIRHIGLRILRHLAHSGPTVLPCLGALRNVPPHPSHSLRTPKYHYHVLPSFHPVLKFCVYGSGSALPPLPCGLVCALPRFFHMFLCITTYYTRGVCIRVLRRMFVWAGVVGNDLMPL